MKVLLGSHVDDKVMALLLTEWLLVSIHDLRQEAQLAGLTQPPPESGFDPEAKL